MTRTGKEGHVGEWSILYGDAVVTGPADRYGNATPVDQSMVDYSSSLDLDRNAMSDWDTCNVGSTVMEWKDLGRDDGGHGLGF